MEKFPMDVMMTRVITAFRTHRLMFTVPDVMRLASLTG